MSGQDRHELRDGRVVVYLRDASPYYQMRLKIHGVTGYITRSTKCRSLSEALVVASETYDDLRYKAQHGLDVKPHTFESVWKRWYEAHRNVLSIHRIRYLEGTSERYFLPFFGSLKTDQITSEKVQSYWTWRINYWTSEEGVRKIETAQKSRTTAKRPYKQKLGNVAKVPAQKTLQMEQTALKQILRWANGLGMISRIPEIRAPKISAKKGISRRPAFELAEWQTLYRFLREWVKQPAKEGMKGRGPNSHHLWHRELFRSYVLFMGTTGLRPNEARQLRWRDAVPMNHSDGSEYLLLHISPNTKTGARECVALKGTILYLERIRKISLHTKPDDLIFCDKNGEAIENFGKTFKAVLKEANLLEDRYGNVRTIYSLRHTYATLRILKGGANIEDLAQNMGTSPTQIYQHYRHITVRQKANELSGKLHREMSTKGLYF